MLRLDDLIAQHDAEEVDKEADRLLEVCDNDDDVAIGPIIEGDDDDGDADVGFDLADNEEIFSMQKVPSFSTYGGGADAGTEPPIGAAAAGLKEEQLKQLFNYSGMNAYSNYAVPQVFSADSNQGQYGDIYEDYYKEYEEDFSDVLCCLVPWAKQEDKSSSSSDTASAWSSSSTPNPAPGFESDFSAADVVGASDKDNYINVEEVKKPLKGILKKCNSVNQGNTKQEDSRRSSLNSIGGQRRSLFPNTPQVVDATRQSFNVSGINKSKILKNLRWASMARVSMVPSSLDLSFAERTAVWWQVRD